MSEDIKTWFLALCLGSVPFTIYIESYIGLAIGILGIVVGCFLLFKY